MNASNPSPKVHPMSFDKRAMLHGIYLGVLIGAALVLLPLAWILNHG